MENNSKIVILIILVVIITFGGVLWVLDDSENSTIINAAHSNNINSQSWINVSYAHASAAEKMDIYLPNTTGPYPVIIAIHGGSFYKGDKNSSKINEIKQAALERGYAYISINYRLSSEAKFPAQIEDVKAAIRYIRANANKYDINPNEIGVIGNSAGGYLAALTGTSGGVAEFQNSSLGNSNVSDNVKAVVDLYGPIDFSTIDQQFNESGINGETCNISSSLESKLMGHDISAIPSQVTGANPETYISRDDPAFFIQHGSADKIIPYQQSVDFAAKLKSVIGDEKVYLEIIQGAEHGDKQFFTAENIKKILDFFDANLKQS